MSELTSRDCTELYKKAVARATKDGDDYVLTLLKGINPKRMTRADIDMCDDILITEQERVKREGRW